MKPLPQHPALVSAEGSLSYEELGERIELTIGQLHSFGVRPGIAVGIVGPSTITTFLLAHAIPRMGAIFVPINRRWNDSTIRRALEEARVEILISERPIEGVAVHLLDEIVDRVPKERLRIDEADPERIATILFTSGSSGRPKGVMLTWENHLASARASTERLHLERDDRWLACLPLFHVGGLNILYRAAMAGATVVLHEGFSPERVNDSIDRDHVSLASFVPTMLRRVLDHRGDRPFPERLRAILLGGGSIPPRLIDDCPLALPTYGLTEACSHVTLVRTDAGESERESAGPALPGIEVRILDRDGAEAPVGTCGMITVRGPVVMAGYVGDVAAIDGTIRDGWLRTRDLGRLDRLGNLHVVGRSDDAIRSGGETIYPAEIEAALDHPEIAEAVVLGVRDPVWGQAPVAFIVARADSLREGDVLEWVAPNLDRYKWPRIVFVARIPRLPNGKPDRERLLAGYDPSPSDSL